ncbi:MAG: ATP/GTP-binding protein [Gammaproteobacteria bacterium]|nr:ATP/GTP-binding protein [Gammaproteobacteria bacterium]
MSNAITDARQVKIVFSGPVGSGKTTSLYTISDDKPVGTEVQSNEDIGKSTTTVAMDYGTLQLESGVKIHLYATPGQERFSYMWDILGKGSAGVVLLVDQSRPSPLAELKFFLGEFRKIVKDAPIVIGLTKMDLAKETHLDKIYKYLEDEGLEYPVFELDTRDKAKVKEIVLSLMFLIQPDLMKAG